MPRPKVNEEVHEAIRAVMGIVQHLVDHPAEVEINYRPGAYRVGIELYTNPKDVGQVVGRNGYLGTSLRAFLAAIAGKHKVKINLDYVTEEDNAREKGGNRANAG